MSKNWHVWYTTWEDVHVKVPIAQKEPNAVGLDTAEQAAMRYCEERNDEHFDGDTYEVTVIEDRLGAVAEFFEITAHVDITFSAEDVTKHIREEAGDHGFDSQPEES